MVFVTLRALCRLPYAYGTLGLVVLLGHYVDGLFDIFWIGALSIAPVHHRRHLAGDRPTPIRGTGTWPTGRAAGRGPVASPAARGGTGADRSPALRTPGPTPDAGGRVGGPAPWPCAG